MHPKSTAARPARWLISLLLRRAISRHLRQTGNSRGFGFVEMAEGMEEAIQALNTAQFG